MVGRAAQQTSRGSAAISRGGNFYYIFRQFSNLLPVSTTCIILSKKIWNMKFGREKTAKQYQIPSLMPIVFFFSCIMFFLGYFHWSVFFHWHFLFCYAFCLYFPLWYVFSIDISIGLCLPLLFFLVLFFPSLNYVFCWYFLLCYADPATDLCHSWNFLPASRLLPQLLTAFFSGNLGIYGIQQKIYNVFGRIIFLDNISHCLIALLVWFCFIPLFSFRLLCKERALCIFPEILSQKGVTDGLSHAFVMQALLCYWWRNVLWTESIFIILDDQKPCTFSKVGWDAFSNWGEIVLKKNEMSNIFVF